MKKILVVLFSLLSLSLFSQSQGAATQPAGAKIRPDQLRWTESITSGDSVWVLSADQATGRPAWYKKYFADPSVVAMNGDVIGTTANSFVKAISGVQVRNVAPILGQVLQYDGTKWTPTTLFIPVTLSGDVTGGTGATVVRKLQGVGIDSITPALNNALIFNGTKWQPSAISSSMLSWLGNNKDVYFKDGSTLGTSSKLTFDKTVGGMSIDGGSLTVKGLSTTSATRSLQLMDSNGDTRFAVLDNGRLEIGKQTNAATQNTSVIKAEGSDANISIALTPKGNGAFSLATPDGTVTGGNARGQGAVDLQTVRSVATQVASGNYSFIGGGQNNTASGQNSFVGGGSGNVASGNYSSAVGGSSNVASGENSFVGVGDYSQTSGTQSSSFGSNADSYVYGGFAQSNLSFSARNGYTQANQFVAAQKSTGSSDFYVKIGDTRIEGGGEHWIPKGTNRNVRVRMQVIITTNDKGNGSGTTGDVYSSDITFAVKKVANNISILATPVEENKQYDTSMSTLSISVTADNVTKEVKIKVTPPSGTGSTTKFRAVATLRCTEVAW